MSGFTEIKNARIYLTEGEIIITGNPKEHTDYDEELGHNCDQMGCGSVSSHILMRFEKPNHILTPHEICKKYQVQQCHICNDFDCGDNHNSVRILP